MLWSPHDPSQPVSYTALNSTFEDTWREVFGEVAPNGLAFHGFFRTVISTIVDELGVSQAAEYTGRTIRTIESHYKRVRRETQNRTADLLDQVRAEGGRRPPNHNDNSQRTDEQAETKGKTGAFRPRFSSRGRTVREFVFGVLLTPAIFTFFWFTVFGNTALWLEQGGAGLAAIVEDDFPIALFAMLEMLPYGAPLFSGIALIVVFLFFVTSSGSGSLVVDQITAGGRTDSPVKQRLFWALTEGAIAGVLLIGGGITALSNVVTAMGLPFCVVLVFVAVGLGKALGRESEAATAQTS